MYFHIAQDAQAIGLQIVDPGHHVEKVMIAGVAKKMARMCEDKNTLLNLYNLLFIQNRFYSCKRGNIYGE